MATKVILHKPCATQQKKQPTSKGTTTTITQRGIT
jgi:hypothetical protein